MSQSKVPTKAFIDAISFLSILSSVPSLEVIIPSITINKVDVEVTFIWSTDKVSVELGFSGDGKYNYYAYLIEDKSVEWLSPTEDCLLDEPLPFELLMSMQSGA